MSDFKAALEDFKNGKFLIVTDDADRENEGDLILLAQSATTEQLGFMVRHTSGVICGVITEEIAKRLKLPMMVARNEDSHETAFIRISAPRTYLPSCCSSWWRARARWTY